MNNNNKDVIISLADPILLVQSVFKEEAERYKKDYVNNMEPYRVMMEYDASAFINAMLDEIFNGPVITNNVFNLPSSTLILVNDGLDMDIAKELALIVFNCIIEIISNFIPDINFGEDRYRIQQVNKYDIIVMRDYFNDFANSYDRY